MAIFTMDGKVLSAILFSRLHNEIEHERLKGRNGLWVAIGQTEDYEQEQYTCTPDTTSNIPIEVMDHCNYNFGYDSTGVNTGIQAMKRAEEVHIVIPDATGEILFDETAYTVISDIDEMFTLDAHWVYLKFVLRYSELPITPFRQIGIFYDPDLTRAGPYADVILEDELMNINEGTGKGVGRLVYYSNSSVRYRHENQKDILEIVIQF